MIATKEGDLYGYNPLVDISNAYRVVQATHECSYRGLTVVGNHLYAADFLGGRIDVFDFNFHEVHEFPFVDGDSDKPLPTHFAPFNLVCIDGYLYVSYALRRGVDDLLPGHGHGYISLFNVDGSLSALPAKEP